MKAAEGDHGKAVQGVDAGISTLAQIDLDAKRLRRHLLLRRFWKSASGFWRAGGDRHSWILSGTILLTVLLSLAAVYGINIWNRKIFDALERRDASTVLFWSIIYFPLLATSVSLVVAQVYARMTTQWRWRACLNNHCLIAG